MNFSFLSELLSSDAIKNITLNTLFVSIPEELFWVMFIYIMMGEFDHWKDASNNKLFYKEDYARVFVPVVLTALLSNILRYSGIDNNIVSLVTIFTLFFSIIAFGDIFNNSGAVKWVAKVFLFLVLGASIIFLCEMLYIPFILYGTGMEIKELNSNIFRNIVISIPARVFQYLFLFIILVNKISSKSKFTIKKFFVHSRMSLITICLLLFFHLIFIINMTNLIALQKILISLQPFNRLITVVIISVFPVINLICIIILVYIFYKYKIKSDAQLYRDIINISNNLGQFIQIYSKNNDLNSLRYIKQDLDNLASTLDNTDDT